MLPAAALTWLLANIFIGDTSLLMYFVNFLDPFAKMLGLDGFILAAFILGLPANEIVIPILLMSYLSTGALTEIDDFNQIKNLFLENGWTWLTALNTMLFSLLHFPCGTTLVNIYKETKVQNGHSYRLQSLPLSPLLLHSSLHNWYIG